MTYADILANPDDIELNLAFAQNQIADGNVQGASAAYERILLIQPENARVRLLYAIVLFRLDSLKEAERELKTVGKLKMAAGLRSQIDYYLQQIKLRSKATRYAFMVSAGGQYDWNKNSARHRASFLRLIFWAPWMTMTGEPMTMPITAPPVWNSPTIWDIRRAIA